MQAVPRCVARVVVASTSLVSRTHGATVLSRCCACACACLCACLQAAIVALSRYCRCVYVNEYLTSQRCSVCASTRHYVEECATRRTVSCTNPACTLFNTPVCRDQNSAQNLARAFFQWAHSHTRPEYLDSVNAWRWAANCDPPEWSTASVLPETVEDLHRVLEEWEAAKVRREEAAAKRKKKQKRRKKKQKQKQHGDTIAAGGSSTSRQATRGRAGDGVPVHTSGGSLSHRGRGRGAMKRTAAWLAVGEDESKGDDSDGDDGGMSYESDMEEDDDVVLHPCPKRMYARRDVPPVPSSHGSFLTVLAQQAVSLRMILDRTSADPTGRDVLVDGHGSGAGLRAGAAPAAWSEPIPQPRMTLRGTPSPDPVPSSRC